MPPLHKTIYASPQDAENAYYEAIENANIESMMSVWAEDEEIACVNPGGVRLIGYNAIREHWLHIFESGTRLTVRHILSCSSQSPFSAVHSVVEEVGVQGDATRRAPLLATNMYVRGAMGWRMVAHHASPSSPDLPPSTAKVLH